jgi:hypothetical protein
MIADQMSFLPGAAYYFRILVRALAHYEERCLDVFFPE